MKNCDTRDVLTEKDKQGKLLYGKKILTSDSKYNLWNRETDEFDIKRIEDLYECFVWNMHMVMDDFEPIWVPNKLLLTTTKGLIWDWNDEEERMRTAESIHKCGMYFPILVLPRGILHNQIATEDELEELKAKNLYNSYNGNHRIDAIKCLIEQGLMNEDDEVLVYIIPPTCQKSCTGFKYTPINDSVDNELTKNKLKKPILMVHMDYVEHEMKVTNWRDREVVEDGISLVMVDNENVAFRIILELQNILEPALTRYYELHRTLPGRVIEMSRCFNKKEV